MKILHGMIAIGFIVLGLSIYSSTKKPVPALVALLIGNVSLAAISIENALDKTPIETGFTEPEGPEAPRLPDEPPR